MDLATLYAVLLAEVVFFSFVGCVYGVISFRKSSLAKKACIISPLVFALSLTVFIFYVVDWIKLVR